jgi:hypothetical protein
MSIPRRSPRIAHLTAASEKRQAAMWTKSRATPYIKTISIRFNWRKMDGTFPIDDWHFIMDITMSNNTKRTRDFWTGNVCMTDTYIGFSYGDVITLRNGRVCLIDRYTQDFLLFARHITLKRVKKALLPYVTYMSHDTYRFDFDWPVGTFPWDVKTHTYVLSF